MKIYKFNTLGENCMRKKPLIITTVFLLVIIVIGSCTYYLYNFLLPLFPIKNEIDIHTISGKFVLQNHFNGFESDETGLLLYEPSTDTRKTVLQGHLVSQAFQNKSKDKLFLVDDDIYELNGTLYSVYEYDLREDKTKPIIQYDDTVSLYNLDLHYINDILSFNNQSGLTIFNLINKSLIT